MFLLSKLPIMCVLQSQIIKHVVSDLYMSQLFELNYYGNQFSN